MLSSRASRLAETAEELAASKDTNARLELEVKWLKEVAAGDKKTLAATRKRLEVAEDQGAGGGLAVIPPFEVTEEDNPKASFFEWLEAQLPAVPSIIEKSCKFASLFSTEAPLNLLEGHKCEHVGDLADPTVVSVNKDSSEGMSKVVQEPAWRVVSEYWLAHGRETAPIDAVAWLNAVSAPSFPFPLILFFFVYLEPLVIDLIHNISRPRMPKPRSETRKGNANERSRPPAKGEAGAQHRVAAKRDHLRPLSLAPKKWLPR